MSYAHAVAAIGFATTFSAAIKSKLYKNYCDTDTVGLTSRISQATMIFVGLTGRIGQATMIFVGLTGRISQATMIFVGLTGRISQATMTFVGLTGRMVTRSDK